MKPEVQFAQTASLPPAVVTREDVFDYLMHLPGKSYRAVATRETVRVELASQTYFIKRHHGVGWGELFKNWLTGKRPVVSADNEVCAIQALTRLGIATTPYVAHGKRGCFPAHIDSFVMTQDLGEILTLEDLALAWQTNPPPLSVKRTMIRRVAEIAGKMHAQGIYHRDFYLCHFCMKTATLNIKDPQLIVLDLHRAEIHPALSKTMQMKDLAALYFSALDLALNRGDKIVFMRSYQPDVEWRSGDKQFWQQVSARAYRLYAKYKRKKRAGIHM